MAVSFTPDNAFEEYLRSTLRSNIRDALQEIADPIIDAAADNAVSEFETRLQAQKDIMLDQTIVKFSVVRTKEPKK